MPRTFAAFVASLLLAAGISLAQTAAPPAPTTAPAVEQDPVVPAAKYEKDGVTPQARFMKMHEDFVRRAAQGDVDVVFLGDSITAGWAGNGKAIWKSKYAPRKAVNFGIGGDHTQNVLWRVENGELDGLRPKVVVLMIGTNNTGNDAPERIAEGVTKIVNLVREKTGGAKVLLLGVFPRGFDDAHGGERRQKVWRVNEIIRGLDDGQTVRYLDLKDKFMQPDGTITKEIMPDALHLSPAGYQIWADAMEPLLAEMLAE